LRGGRKTDDSWRQELREALDQFSRTKPVDDAVWQFLFEEYLLLHGRHYGPAAYEKLEKQLSSFGSERCGATCCSTWPLAQPIGVVAEHCIGRACCTRTGEPGRLAADCGRETVRARPGFGPSVNSELTRLRDEEQVFRIDHYLARKRPELFDVPLFELDLRTVVESGFR